MNPFTSIGEAFAATVRFDREKFAAMPEHVQAELDRLSGLGISPVDRIVRTGELLFANREKLTRVADKEMVGQLVEFAAGNGWHGMNEGNRAGKIKAVMAAEAGGPAVAPKDVPLPRDEFLPKLKVAPTPAPAATPAPTPVA